MSQGWIGVFPKDVWTLIIDCMYPRYAKEPWWWLVQSDKITNYTVIVKKHHPSFEKMKEDWKKWRDPSNINFNPQVINPDMRCAMRFRSVCKHLNDIVIARCGFYTIGFVGQMTIRMLMYYTQCLREKRSQLREFETKAENMRKQYCDCELMINKKEKKILTLRAIYTDTPTQYVYDLINKYNREIAVYENGKKVFRFWEAQKERKLVKKDLKTLRPWNGCGNILQWSKFNLISQEPHDLLWI